MRQLIVGGVLLIGLVGAPAPEVAAQVGAPGRTESAPATPYKFHPSHTTIRFTAGFLGIVEVEGRFNDFYGSFLYDEEDFTQSSLLVVVLSSSVDSNAEGRDRDLRSERFLDAIRFPGATFRSTRIEARGEGYLAVGDLTIRGVTKEIAVPFSITGRTTFPFSDTRFVGMEAGFAINRQDFGMTWEQVLDNGALFASNEVRIDARIALVEVEGLEREAYRQYPAVPMDEGDLRRFSGTYAQHDPAQEVEVALVDGHLIARMRGELGAGTLLLVPVGADAFRVAGLSSRDLGFLHFHPDEDVGQATLERRKPDDTLSVALNRVLTFEGFQRVILEQGIRAAVLRYRAFQQGLPAWFTPFDEAEMDRLGSRLLRDEQAEAAIEVFKLNAEGHPGSWRAHESLAESYLIGGRRDLALQSYRKALELSPDDEDLRQRLQEAIDP